MNKNLCNITIWNYSMGNQSADTASSNRTTRMWTRKWWWSLGSDPGWLTFRTSVFTISKRPQEQPVWLGESKPFDFSSYFHIYNLIRSRRKEEEIQGNQFMEKRENLKKNSDCVMEKKLNWNIPHRARMEFQPVQESVLSTHMSTTESLGAI